MSKITKEVLEKKTVILHRYCDKCGREISYTELQQCDITLRAQMYIPAHESHFGIWKDEKFIVRDLEDVCMPCAIKAFDILEKHGYKIKKEN